MQVDIRNVPDAIVLAVDADARQRGVSRNDVIAETVAQRYGLDWKPSGYPYLEADLSDHWNLRLTATMRDALKAHARAIGGTMTGCVLLALGSRYGIRVAPPRRRGKTMDPRVVADARDRHANGESLRKLAAEYRVGRRQLTAAIRA